MTAETRPLPRPATWPLTRRATEVGRVVHACAVIPVFDNAGTVAAVALAVSRHVDLVIVVDDGSGDSSGDAARAAALDVRAGRRIEVLTLPVNQGKGAALAAGFRRALILGRTHAVTVDADGQHLASDIPALLEAARAHPRAIILGARDMDSARIPGAARVGRRISNFWTLRSTGFALPDTTCGFRVYPIGDVVDLPLRTRRYDYEGEVLVRGAWAGLDLQSVPIEVWYPAERSARVSHYRPWVDSTRITAMYARLAFRRLLPMGARGPVARGPLARAHLELVGPPQPSGLRGAWRRLREVAAAGTHANEIALAVGIGVFLGATPLWGLHAASALYVAARWRLNPVATFLAANVSFPPFAPFLVFAGVQCGHRMLHGEWLDLARSEFTVASAWSHATDYVVGAFAVAAVLGVVAGLTAMVVGGAVERRRVASRARQAAPRATSRTHAAQDLGPAGA